MNKELSRSIMVLGLLLAIGLAAAAFIFGIQAKHIGAGRQSISVKGLAEKPVTADYAEWTIGVMVIAPTFAEALAELRSLKPTLTQFLVKQGFEPIVQKEGNEEVAPNVVPEHTKNGEVKQVQIGFIASQKINVTSKDLPKMVLAHKAALQLRADGFPAQYSAPQYLVSDLEGKKMSLIGLATENAQKRAEEFAKYGGVKVGSMRSASQGAFYILPVGSVVEAGEYGGYYDKSSIEKIARVVVTIEFNITN
jgi:uncharacterized protein